ncbi:P-loop NTPase fold protein [Dactylosporangium cerinum]|uniref:P-loop NTPase fold protein n=1 Tax=Dactylosporangium cerinum TaxID=1434730 RepID=A0ABV9WKS3_9ACTN
MPQKEADRIGGKNARLVFFADDLDRCEPDHIIDLIESVKPFLDLSNAFVVPAIAKEPNPRKSLYLFLEQAAFLRGASAR